VIGRGGGKGAKGGAREEEGFLAACLFVVPKKMRNGKKGKRLLRTERGSEIAGGVKAA